MNRYYKVVRSTIEYIRFKTKRGVRVRVSLDIFFFISRKLKECSLIVRQAFVLHKYKQTIEEGKKVFSIFSALDKRLPIIYLYLDSWTIDTHFLFSSGSTMDCTVASVGILSIFIIATFTWSKIKRYWSENSLVSADGTII